jgi:hypothetical protein
MMSISAIRHSVSAGRESKVITTTIENLPCRHSTCGVLPMTKEFSLSMIKECTLSPVPAANSDLPLQST